MLDDFNKEKADALVEALRAVAKRIEKGYEMEEKQKTLIAMVFEEFAIEPDAIAQKESEIRGLRTIANQIENGCLVEEQQEKSVIKLFRGFITRTQKLEYQAKTPRLQPRRLLEEEETEEEELKQEEFFTQEDTSFQQRTQESTRKTRNIIDFWQYDRRKRQSGYVETGGKKVDSGIEPGE